MQLQPLGYKIIVKPIEQEEFKTEGGIIGVNLLLDKGEVVEFSPDFKDVYKKGDIVLFPQKSGNGVLYNGTPHLFLDGRGAPQGDVWAIEKQDEK